MDGRTALVAAALRRRRIASAAELAAEIGVSQPTLSRLLRALGDSVVSVGKARRARYALLRSVRGLPTALPIYRVGPTGQPCQCGTLAAIDPEGAHLRDAAAIGWPLDETMREGIFPGVPYFILDMRPQGFLGRAFAREHAAHLNLPVDPTRWSDDDVLVALASAGEDMPGDLIVGAQAVEAFQRRRAARIVPVRLHERVASYPERATAALLGDAPGSSAGGEFAKFTGTIEAQDGARHVIVKFSPADDNAAAARWRDLLIAEHHAPAALSGIGVPAAASDIVLSAGRVFLEVSRFDRVGEHGRRAALTLGAIEPALLGLGDVRWESAAAELHRRGWLSEDDVAQITRLSIFGDFIGNSDMHGGNLAFLQSAAGQLSLAPAYDMLPMLFAPARSGELVARRLAARPPVPGVEALWREALAAAFNYWSRLTDDERISDSFRQICTVNQRQLEELGDRFS